MLHHVNKVYKFWSTKQADLLVLALLALNPNHKRESNKNRVDDRPPSGGREQSRSNNFDIRNYFVFHKTIIFTIVCFQWQYACINSI